MIWSHPATNPHDDLKKFLDDERALHNQMDALKTERYLFALGGLVIGLAIGLFVMSKRNKEGEDKW